MNAIFGALQQGWPDAKLNSREQSDYYVLWGIFRETLPYFRGEWIFTDMPYHGRLDPSGSNMDKSYWRWCYKGLHDSTVLDVPSDRFEDWNVEVKPWDLSGDYILICPSSETVTQYLHGQSVDQWITWVETTLRKFTNLPFKIRKKPRGKGTSGPSVAKVSIEEDLAGAKAMITSASLSSVDALKAGVPVFSTSRQCPTAWCTNFDFNKINNPVLFDREQLFYNLAYKQFSIEEMRNGIHYETQRRLSHNKIR